MQKATSRRSHTDHSLGGNVQAESLLLVLALAFAGSTGLSNLGSANRTAIAGTVHGASPNATTIAAQAAGLEAAAELTRAAKSVVHDAELAKRVARTRHLKTGLRTAGVALVGLGFAGVGPAAVAPGAALIASADRLAHWITRLDVPTLGARAEDLAHVTPTKNVNLFVHGFNSSKRVFGFHKDVLAALRRDGHFVEAVDFSPYAAPEVVAKEIDGHVQRILAEYSAKGIDVDGVNIIAHSLGTAATIAAEHPGIRSATLYAGALEGSRVADVLHKVIPKMLYPIIDRGAGFLGKHVYRNTSTRAADFEGTLRSMTREAAVLYNEAHPPNPDVEYFVWGGITGKVKPTELGAKLDPLYLHHDGTYAIERGPFKLTDRLFGEPNDGLVSSRLSMWPSADAHPNVHLQGIMPGDHLDEVGGMPFLHPHKNRWTGFDSKQFMRGVLADLSDRGF